MVSVLRICTALDLSEESHAVDTVLATLRPLLSKELVGSSQAEILGERVMSGLLMLIKLNGPHINLPETWDLVFSLIAMYARHPSPVATDAAFEAAQSALTPTTDAVGGQGQQGQHQQQQQGGGQGLFEHVPVASLPAAIACLRHFTDDNASSGILGAPMATAVAATAPIMATTADAGETTPVVRATPTSPSAAAGAGAGAEAGDNSSPATIRSIEGSGQGSRSLLVLNLLQRLWPILESRAASCALSQRKVYAHAGRAVMETLGVLCVTFAFLVTITTATVATCRQ